jgi:hypothetical protein
VVCGDGQCTGFENPSNCPQDCKPNTVCGDGICNGMENQFSCPQDCIGGCGDGFCNPFFESRFTCPFDCGFPIFDGGFAGSFGTGGSVGAGGFSGSFGAGGDIIGVGGFGGFTGGTGGFGGTSVGGGFVDGGPCTNGTPPPSVCQSGTDAETKDEYVVCAADCFSAWISTGVSNGGTFHARQICRQLGYSQLGQFGGTSSHVCGYTFDPPDTSCKKPGSQTFDGEGRQNNDAFGPVLAFSVQWQCIN